MLRSAKYCRRNRRRQSHFALRLCVLPNPHRKFGDSLRGALFVLRGAKCLFTDVGSNSQLATRASSKMVTRDCHCLSVIHIQTAGVALARCQIDLSCNENAIRICLARCQFAFHQIENAFPVVSRAMPSISSRWKIARRCRLLDP